MSTFIRLNRANKIIGLVNVFLIKKVINAKIIVKGKSFSLDVTFN